MKYGVLLGIIVGLAGCGTVEAMLDVDGGEMGGAGGSSGMAGTTGTAGTIDAGGTTGTGGSTVECQPDACNTCVGGARVPKTDGTQCGLGLCDDVLPFEGQDGCISQNQACQAGTCVLTVINCCRDTVCPVGKQARCSATRASDPTIPSYCTTCSFPPKP